MSGTGGVPSQRRGDRAGLVIAVILMAIGITIVISTSRMGGVAIYSPVGPKTFPYIIGGGLIILGALTVIEALRGGFPARDRQSFGPMAWIVGGLAVQMLTMKTVGFSISTGLLFAATAMGFGRGPLWKTVPIGIVFSFLIWFLFAKGLQLSLPAGPLERLF